MVSLYQSKRFTLNVIVLQEENLIKKSRNGL